MARQCSCRNTEPETWFFGRVRSEVRLYSCTTEEADGIQDASVPAEWNQMFLEQQISGLFYRYELEGRFQTRFQLQKTWKCS